MTIKKERIFIEIKIILSSLNIKKSTVQISMTREISNIDKDFILNI